MTPPMPNARCPGILGGLLLSAMLALPASGAVLAVELESRYGPRWTGSVDTLADTFTLEGWTENPGLSEAWTPWPSSLPIVFHARAAAGGAYDVPDDGWSGAIGPDWAFIGPDLGEIRWRQGSAPLFSGYGVRVAWGATSSLGQGLDFSRDEFTGGAVLLARNLMSTGIRFDRVAIVPEPGAAVLMLAAGGAAATRRRPR